MRRFLAWVKAVGYEHLRSSWYFLLDDLQSLLLGRHLWVLLAAQVVAIALCLTVRMTGPGTLRVEDELDVPAEKGQLTLLFGTIRADLFRGGDEAVHLIHCWILRWGLGPVGVLLGLTCTAGIMPTFLQSGTAILVFTAPVHRLSVALRKYFALVFVMTAWAVGLSLSTGVSLALVTGYWPGTGLGAAGVYALAFASFLGFSLLLGVLVRSTAAVVVGDILFWLVCYAVNVSHWRFGESAVVTTIAALPYWCLPKPADLLVMLDKSIGAELHFASLPELLNVEPTGLCCPWLSIATSAGFGLVMAVLAGWELRTVEVSSNS